LLVDAQGTSKGPAHWELSYSKLPPAAPPRLHPPPACCCRLLLLRLVGRSQHKGRAVACRRLLPKATKRRRLLRLLLAAPWCRRLLLAKASECW
jgi:hypothetical protein